MTGIPLSFCCLIDPPVEIALDTLVIAGKYGLKHLKRLCEGLAFTDLSCDFFYLRGDITVVDVLIVADRVGCKDLKERAMAILPDFIHKIRISHSGGTCQAHE